MLKFDSGLLEAEVIELFNRVIVSNIPLGTLADANSYMMMISGGIIMFIAILGLCGAWHKLNGCLWTVSILDVSLDRVSNLKDKVHARVQKFSSGCVCGGGGVLKF